MSSGSLINVCPTVQIVIGATKLDIYTAYDTMIHGTEDIEPDTASTNISTTYTDSTDVQKDIIDSIQKVTMWLAAQKDTVDIQTSDSVQKVPMPAEKETVDIQTQTSVELESYESMMEPAKKKRCAPKKRICPVLGCKNNEPLILSAHLRCVHRLSRSERMYWLKKQ